LSTTIKPDKASEPVCYLTIAKSIAPPPPSCLSAVSLLFLISGSKFSCVSKLHDDYMKTLHARKMQQFPHQRFYLFTLPTLLSHSYLLSTNMLSSAPLLADIRTEDTSPQLEVCLELVWGSKLKQRVQGRRCTANGTMIDFL
jgi:hypothetical protein